MTDGKSALAVFMDKILEKFSPIGMLAVFFGTILVLSAILALGKVGLLAGIDLLLLAAADWIWRNRDPYPLVLFPHERVAPYRRRHFYRCFLAAMLFLGFIGLAIYVLRLPPVLRFLIAE